MRNNSKKHNNHKHKAFKLKSKHRVYNVKNNDSLREFSSDNLKLEKSVDDKLATLFKEVVNKICNDD